MVFGCISKNFPENIFWCMEKKKENTNPEKHKPQPRKKSSTTTNPVRRPRRRSRSIPVFGSFKYFYKKCIKSGKRNQNPAKEIESTTSNERCDRGATSGAMSDEWRAVRSSIDERACRTRTAHRSRRLSIDERWDRPDDRTARRAVRSWCDEWRAVRSSIDERACWTRTAHRSRRSSIDERACRTRTTHRLRRSSIDERCDRPNDRTARSHRSQSSIDERRDLGSLFSLSLSLSFSGNELKWKWGWKIISGSKVKISVNRKLFSGKWNLPSLSNAWVWGKMISWNHFHPKQTHPKFQISWWVYWKSFDQIGKAKLQW